MSNRKTGKYFICPNCNKEFYIIKCRINKCKIHYCSIKCSSKYTAFQRAKKLRKKEYPFIFKDKCKYCGGKIIIKKASDDKENRQFCSKSCHRSYENKRMVWTDEMRAKVSRTCRNTFKGKARNKEWILKQAESISGEKHWNWQGGKTKKTLIIRNSKEYRYWRKAVFERDNYTCQECGKRGGYLNADHIKSFAHYPKLRFEVDNGRTLCLKCHKKTKTFGAKNLFKEIKQFDLDGNFIKKWKSLRFAVNELRISGTAVGNCLHGRSRSSGGFKWKF